MFYCLLYLTLHLITLPFLFLKVKYRRLLYTKIEKASVKFRTMPFLSSFDSLFWIPCWVGMETHFCPQHGLAHLWTLQHNTFQIHVFILLICLFIDKVCCVAQACLGVSIDLPPPGLHRWKYWIARVCLMPGSSSFLEELAACVIHFQLSKVDFSLQKSLKIYFPFHSEFYFRSFWTSCHFQFLPANQKC